MFTNDIVSFEQPDPDMVAQNKRSRLAQCYLQIHYLCFWHFKGLAIAINTHNSLCMPLFRLKQRTDQTMQIRLPTSFSCSHMP